MLVEIDAIAVVKESPRGAPARGGGRDA